MPNAALPLQDLTQQISQRESELERLRQEYEARRTQLADLARRKEELRGQLKQVDAEIQAVKQGSPTESIDAPAAPPPAPSGKPPRLIDLLIDVVGAAGGPITVTRLAAEVTRRKFPTTSSNIRNMVATRVKELVDKGILRRAEGQPGVLPGTQKTVSDSASPKPGIDGLTQPAKAKKQKKSAKAKPAPRTGQPPLRSVLTDLLKKSRKPLLARELAEQALAGGYQTKSKDFLSVIWVALGQMDNVENVPGKGYRLKR